MTSSIEPVDKHHRSSAGWYQNIHDITSVWWPVYSCYKIKVFSSFENVVKREIVLQKKSLLDTRRLLKYGWH